MKAATRRLLEDQMVVVAVLGSGKKNDAMWYVPHLEWSGGTASMSYVRCACNIGSVYHASVVRGCVLVSTSSSVIHHFLVSQTPSLGSDASPPPPLHEAVVVAMKTACIQSK